MPRWTPILAVLLLASILGNALFAVRRSRSSGEPGSFNSPSLPADRTAQAGSVAELKESLGLERESNRKLQARIDLLETDKKVLALDAPSGTGKTAKLAAFRDKLRKFKKVMSDPAFKNGIDADPESMVEISEAMMEFSKMAARRTKEPKAYADYLQALYEISLEGNRTALSAGQASALQALLQGYGEELSRIPLVPAGDRLLREVQLEGLTMGGVQALLTDAQRDATEKDSMMEGLPSRNGLSTVYVIKQGGADQIAYQWSTLYQLDDSQLPQAKLAAQSYLDAMARIDSENKKEDPVYSKPGSAKAYGYREQAVRQQLAALNVLQASMTPAQADRLRNQAMKEIHIVDTGTSVVQVTRPEK